MKTKIWIKIKNQNKTTNENGKTNRIKEKLTENNFLLQWMKTVFKATLGTEILYQNKKPKVQNQKPKTENKNGNT